MDYFCLGALQNKFSEISTHLLTVLITSVIFSVEQRGYLFCGGSEYEY